MEFLGCNNCIYFSITSSTCNAFSAGVPLSIIDGQQDHLSTWPNQAGDFVYQPFTEEQKTALDEAQNAENYDEIRATFLTRNNPEDVS